MTRRSLTIAAPVLIITLLAAGRATAADCFFYNSAIGYVCSTQPTPPAFRDPLPFADSFLDKIVYAYEEDYINIYPQPSTAATPLYNVGRGFLYVTIWAPFENNGELWYAINPGQYAREQDIQIVTPSRFHGVEATRQPERPFGWILIDTIPSSTPGGEADPAYAEWERYTFFEVFDAVVAADGWIWYNTGGNRWVRQTNVSIVDADPRPAEVGQGEYWVEVDLYEQSFAAYEGGRMVYAGLLSSGLNRWPTHEGLFQVWSRHLQAKMSGAEGKIDYYFIEDVPHIMYFDNDIALHGAYWHDRFGYKHSHGCVNMPPRDAEWVYNWSEDAPNDLWVWVHTSDPANYFKRYR